MLVIDRTDMGGMSFKEQCDPPKSLGCSLLWWGSTLDDKRDDMRRAMLAFRIWRDAVRRGQTVTHVVHSNYGVDVYVQG